MDALVIIIAAQERLGALRTRVTAEEVVGFPDTEVLRALEVISRRRPARVVMDSRFAATSRGIALKNRVRADPSLAAVRLETADESGEAARPSAAAGRSDAPKHPPGPATSTSVAIAAPPQPLDTRGTRRVARITLQPGIDANVDGARVTVIDLSVSGAQVLSPTVLKPNQRVRVSFGDETGTVRCSAVVAWARFELSGDAGAAARYRAGLEFIDADADRVGSFAERHRAH